MLRRAFIIGAAELSFLSLLLGWQAWRILPTVVQAPWNLALLIGDALPVAFILFRRSPQDISRDPADVLTAFFGTAAPLLLSPGGQPAAPALPCALLMAAGLVISVYAKLALRRSFGLVAANRGVMSNGPYKLVRHPMYTGYTVTQLGFVLLNPTVENIALCTAALGLQLLRLDAEEKILIHDSAYRDYVAMVPFRLMPGVY